MSWAAGSTISGEAFWTLRDGTATVGLIVPARGGYRVQRRDPVTGSLRELADGVSLEQGARLLTAPIPDQP
jgi:hypothetical protein